MPGPKATLALNLDRHLMQAALPLLQSEQVEAVEWSFDALYRLSGLPAWFEGLVQAYARADSLLGHGIFFSLCDARWREEQAEWLQQLSRCRSKYRLRHLSEHFGFMSGRDFHRGAPICPPLSEATLRVGRDRLLRLQAAAECSVGIENLALAYRADDVRRQGDFLDRMLDATDGFILLDAHNLYCQAHNFGIGLRELAHSYPLERVREIHISGGSWEPHPLAPQGRVRRDTHNDRVPEAVFALLDYLLPRCPGLAFVTLEQMGSALHTQEQQAGFQADFRRMFNLIRQADLPHADPEVGAPHTPATPSPVPYTDPLLARQQQILTALVEDCSSPTEFIRLLRRSDLAHTDWSVEDWNEHMSATIWAIAQKWK